MNGKPRGARRGKKRSKCRRGKMLMVRAGEEEDEDATGGEFGCDFTRGVHEMLHLLLQQSARARPRRVWLRY